MSEIKESVPTLVFGEVLDEKQMLAETEPKQELKEQLDESMLTEEERKMVEEISNLSDLSKKLSGQQRRWNWRFKGNSSENGIYCRIRCGCSMAFTCVQISTG